MEETSMLIEVGMAEMKTGSGPQVLVTRGLGSCVGITLYDERRQMGALAHAMLPNFNTARAQTNRAKFVDSVIPLMLEELKKMGCPGIKLQAKLFGGAHMFSSIPVNSPFNIGVKNIKATHEMLEAHKISIVAEDTGGNYGRTIFLDLTTGIVRVKTIFFGEKEM